jgi:hypothetical protein
MPNGRPGDHPLTDILHYGSSEFSDPVDSMVKAMALHPRFTAVRDEVAKVLLECSPMFKPASERPQLVAQAVARLQVAESRLGA